MRFPLTALTVLAFAAAITAGCEHQNSTAGAPTVAPSTASAPVRAKAVSPPPVAHVPTPDTLRGLYVNRWAALGSKLRTLIDVAKKTEINALVIDVKDDRGFVLYPSDVPLAHEIGADTADGHWMSRGKLRSVLDTLAAHNIYPIARIVVAKDPLLARAKLDLAIKRKSDLEPWLTRTAIRGSTRTIGKYGNTLLISRAKPITSDSAKCSSTTFGFQTTGDWRPRRRIRSRTVACVRK